MRRTGLLRAGLIGLSWLCWIIGLDWAGLGWTGFSAELNRDKLDYLLERLSCYFRWDVLFLNFLIGLALDGLGMYFFQLSLSLIHI